MNARKVIASGLLSVVLGFSGVAHAAPQQEADPTHDARTEGYDPTAQISGSTGLLWILFIFVSVIGMSALFKDSKRARTD